MNICKHCMLVLSFKLVQVLLLNLKAESLKITISIFSNGDHLENGQFVGGHLSECFLLCPKNTWGKINACKSPKLFKLTVTLLNKTKTEVQK